MYLQPHPISFIQLLFDRVFVYGSHGGFVADLFYSQTLAIIDGRRDKR